ncbi:hypothetical protein INT43_007613 [Umbelopsis isabellina]|uniref:Cytochrome c oxidase assembly protein COX19 n=1 Tax=Mortierella isabellina TaxID=91625 RepID=A0A8H7PP25_MORIS|nr:hypothetical protein INT43_007613 [Umbelopsis isabellina]
MGFGRPPNVESFSGKPPALGSFPLDHDGECKDFMKEYIKCVRANKNNNGACRDLSRAYLQCRMERGLMTPDDMKNLGYQDADEKKAASPASASPKAS